MLFKILHGDPSRISFDITPFHEGYCYVTHDGYFYVDMNVGTVETPNNKRLKLNANEAEKIVGYDIATILDSSDAEIPTSKAVFDAIVQSNWDQDDQNAKDYIKNKPDVATKEYVEHEIATFDFIKVVDTLPELGLENRFYMVPKNDTQTQDLFDEYVWINKGTEENPNYGWEWVTTKQIEVDLTNYTTIDKVEEMILERSKKDHEVGSLYISMNSTNPAQIFGFGTWNLIAKNRFLVGAGDDYEAGATGGEAAHTLTAAELPKQNGTISTHGTYAGSPIAAVTGVFGARHTVSSKYMSGSASGANSIDVIEYGNGGKDQAHNNLPPYLAVYIWQRTA